jgi:hypothetical protein
MVPPDLVFVVGSRVGWVQISLYSFSASLHIDFMWLCLVYVRCIIVGFFWVFMMSCRSRIMLCIALVLKVTAFMGGCRYSIVSEMSCCVLGHCVTIIVTPYATLIRTE